VSASGAQARGWTDPAPERVSDPLAVPMLIERVWPEGAMGFIGAAPKAGKTWIAILKALAVATGRPFLGEFPVVRPGPVLYVALEGTREGLRARIGALARGMGIDPEGGGLDGLHLAYKPKGINLSDRAWAARLVDRARELGAVMVTVDVLRRAAAVSEDFKGAADFTALLRNLAELEAERRSLAFCHHFTKPGETQKGRKSADRMAGSGALYAALDAGLFISSSEDGARTMQIEVEARDIRAPRPFRIELSGEATGPNGGWSYLDTVRVRADLGEIPTGEQIMVDQLVALLGAEPDTTKTDAAARIATSRHAADFVRAWPAARAIVAAES
jgi:AAA domain